MNREMIAKVRNRIAEVGNEHCDMSSWSNGRVKAKGELKCGTTACIAGWAMAIQYEEFNQINPRWEDLDESFEDLGMKILGLPGQHLFFKEHWPVENLKIARDEGDGKGMLKILDDILDGNVIVNMHGVFTAEELENNG